MPVTPVPQRWLSDKIISLQRQIDAINRSVNRPVTALHDDNNNVLETVTGAANPVLAARGQDVAVSLGDGGMTVTDESGIDTRPIAASEFNGPLVGDSTGVHHGDVGTSTEGHNHYGDQHGNCYGFHYGPVGDGTTQNQINCLKIFHTGSYGDVGDPATFYQLYGTVHAPSERSLKTEIHDFDAAAVVDAVRSPSWRWDSSVRHDDGERHAGPMVDDIADVAPWLVRTSSDPEAARMLSDRDLIGVLWNALRATREKVTYLESTIETMRSSHREG